jgi:hypothetical protein
MGGRTWETSRADVQKLLVPRSCVHGGHGLRQVVDPLGQSRCTYGAGYGPPEPPVRIIVSWHLKERSPESEEDKSSDER